MAQFRTIESKIIPIEAIPKLRIQLGSRKVITTNGCFDLIHEGHLSYLQKARELGDVLIVGVNSDSSVKQLGKGVERPIFPELTRAKQVAALEFVDYVTLFEESTPVEFIRKAHPDIHVKGGDYSGKRLPEEDVLEEIKAELKLIPMVDGVSTTNIFQKIRQLDS